MAGGLVGGAAFLAPHAVAAGRSPDQDDLAAVSENVAGAVGEDSPSRITIQTIREAEKVLGVEFSDEQREVIRQTIHDQLRMVRARQVAPLPSNHFAPATSFDPRLPGYAGSPTLLERPPSWSSVDPGPLPENEDDIAFAPVTHLSHWIRHRELSSRRLTEIYLDRLAQYDPLLDCVITRTDDLARRQADEADRELAAGHYRGMLHGIPWGAKDLLDTAGIPTTWGAGPLQDRVPETNAAVVRRLHEAGAVLVAKLSLGTLAYGDIWFDGEIRSPWDPRVGASGSSGGSAAATAAGLVGFSIGSETYGSIVSPCMRCGTVGLRPTFGRVDRTGAMALSWSIDKLGPITRTVEDSMVVLDAIAGPVGPEAAEPADLSVYDEPLGYNAYAPVDKLRVGYDPRWFDDIEARQPDSQMLNVLRELGVRMVELKWPHLPYESLQIILFAEAAGAFERLTRTGEDAELRWQDPTAWPNLFRRSRFLSAVDYVQTQRFRRQVMEAYDEMFHEVDLLVGPTYADWLLLSTNLTGHPALTVRTGYVDDQPHGTTFIGRLFDEGTLCQLGRQVEQHLDIWHERPPI